jgi:hypothetical protein
LVINPFSAQGTMGSIDHPSANGTYSTRAEARAAANAFVSAREDY